VAAVRSAYPTLSKPKDVAAQVEAVWERMTGSAPGWPATLGFLAFYGLSVFMCAAAPVGLLVATAQTRVIPATDGSKARQVTLVFGRQVNETELSPEGLYDGRQVTRSSLSGSLTNEGAWLEGRPHGEWKAYDRRGRLERIVVYDRGHFVSCRELSDGQWVEKRLPDMSGAFRQQLARDLAAPPKGTGSRSP
jgi:hypothetical protein